MTLLCVRWNAGPAAGLALALLVSAGQLAQFVQWAAGRSYKNYEGEELGRRINKLKFTMEIETGETGKAFGSITAAMSASRSGKSWGEIGG